LRRVALILCLLAAGAAPAAAADAPPLVPRDPASLEQETHALLRVADASAHATLRRAGGVEVSRSLGIWRVPSAEAARLLPRLALDGAVLDAEPDRARQRLDHLSRGDTLLHHQWWLARVGADRAEPPGPGVPVTVVDGGVDLAHPEFASRPNTVALNEQTLRGRNDYHGTAVASIVGAPADGAGIVGVYPHALLQLWDASPTGSQLTTADVIRGIEAASLRGRGIVNLSLGGVFRSRLEELAIVHAYERGSVVVAASGNEREQGNRPGFPASLPHVVTVGAVDAADRLAPFSSSSPGMDLVAPGVAIPVAVPAAQSPAGYLQADGTSFATPIVSGAAAWIWTVRPELDKTQLVELLRQSARPLDAAGRSPDTGFGLLDIPAALSRPAPSVDPLEPNDDLNQVVPGRMFAAGKAPLTRPGAGRAVVDARLDAVDDPRDVYRVWVPGGGRVVVALTGAAPVALRYAGPTPIRSASRLASRRLELVNRGRAGAFVYVTAAIEPGAQPSFGAYRLALTTGRAPARR